METENNEKADINEEIIDDPKAVLSALERAKNDAKRYREEKEKLENDLTKKNDKIAEFTGKLIREKISQNLAKEGIHDPNRVLKFFDMDSIDFDDDFEIIGFADQLAELKKDFPEIFDAKLRVGGQADAAVKTSVSTKYSASEMQAAKILGKA